MVFKKNMKNIFTCLIITSLLLLSCTNKELFNEKVKVNDYKTISLNVYDFVLVADESSFIFEPLLFLDNRQDLSYLLYY